MLSSASRIFSLSSAVRRSRAMNLVRSPAPRRFSECAQQLDVARAALFAMNWTGIEDVVEEEIDSQLSAAAKRASGEEKVHAERLNTALQAARKSQDIYAAIYECMLQIGDKLGVGGDHAVHAPELVSKAESLMDQYAQLVQEVGGAPDVQKKIVNDLGRQVLVLKSMMHEPLYRQRFHGEFRT